MPPVPVEAQEGAAAAAPEPAGVPQALVPRQQTEEGIIDLDPVQSDVEGIARRVAASPNAAA